MFDAQAIIAEATKDVAQEPVAATSEEAQKAETPTESPEQTEEDIGKKPDSELTPEQLEKREANRQSHLNRKLAKQRLREENRELKSRLEKLEQTVSSKQPQADNLPADYPREENYEDVLSYFKAVAKYEAKQELQAAQQTKQADKIDAAKVQVVQNVAKQADALVKQVPEYKTLYADHQDILAAMPESVMDAFLEAENAPLALYALMKEGRLEDLEDLSASRLAMEIGRAEERGKAYVSAVKKVTTAPPPIESLKGTGRSAKPLDELSIPELMKRFNK